MEGTYLHFANLEQTQAEKVAGIAQNYFKDEKNTADAWGKRLHLRHTIDHLESGRKI